jgi:DNA-directed RNA polymerase subunit RPC12/RpoP
MNRSERGRAMGTIRCTACSSENVQKLSLAYSAGLTNVNLRGTGRTTGVGVGAGTGGLGIGIGLSRSSGTTTGTQQTELSKLVAPPSKEFPVSQKAVWIALGLAAVVSYPAFARITPESGISILVGGVISLVLFATVAFAAFAIVNALLVPKAEKKAAAERYAAALREWEQKFLCMTCGAQFHSS